MQKDEKISKQGDGAGSGVKNGDREVDVREAADAPEMFPPQRKSRVGRVFSAATALTMAATPFGMAGCSDGSSGRTTTEPPGKTEPAHAGGDSGEAASSGETAPGGGNTSAGQTAPGGENTSAGQTAPAGGTAPGEQSPSAGGQAKPSLTAAPDGGVAPPRRPYPPGTRYGLVKLKHLNRTRTQG
jgi:hypothetical protein